MGMEEFLLALAKELAVPVIFGIASIYLILVSDTGRWGNGELSLSTKTILNYLGWILFSIFLFMMGLASVPIVDKFFGNPRYSLGFFELFYVIPLWMIAFFVSIFIYSKVYNKWFAPKKYEQMQETVEKLEKKLNDIHKSIEKERRRKR